jgi:hypothetical protein
VDAKRLKASLRSPSPQRGSERQLLRGTAKSHPRAMAAKRKSDNLGANHSLAGLPCGKRVGGSGETPKQLSAARCWRPVRTASIHFYREKKKSLNRRFADTAGLLIRVQQMPLAFHLLGRRNAFRRRDVRLQSRLFARWNQSLRRSANSIRLC